jgi:hypothetical protein
MMPKNFGQYIHYLLRLSNVRRSARLWDPGAPQELNFARPERVAQLLDDCGIIAA